MMPSRPLPTADMLRTPSIALALVLATASMTPLALAAGTQTSAPLTTLPGVPNPCGTLTVGFVCQSVTITSPTKGQSLAVPFDNPIVTIAGLADKDGAVYVYLLWEGTRVVNPREAYRATTDSTGKFELRITFPDTGDFSVVGFARATMQEHGNDRTFFQTTLTPPVPFHVDVQAPPTDVGDLGDCSEAFDLTTAVVIRETPLVRQIPADPDNPRANWTLTDLGEVDPATLSPALSYCMDEERVQRVVFRSGIDPLLIVRSDADRTVRVRPTSELALTNRGLGADGTWTFRVSAGSTASAQYQVPTLPTLRTDGPSLVVRAEDLPAAVASLVRAAGAPAEDAARVLTLELAPLALTSGTYELQRIDAESIARALPLDVITTATVVRTFIQIRPLVGPAPALSLPAPTSFVQASGVDVREYGIVLAR